MARQTAVAIYLRVSTRDQHLAEQFRVLRVEAQHRGWRVVGVYRDRVSSKIHRPALARMLADAAMRRCDVVLVRHLDRLGRSVIEVVANVRALNGRGVQVVVLHGGALDTTTAAGRFQVSTLAAVAELERDLIAERTREGLARVRRHGSASGRPIGGRELPLDLEAIRARVAAGESRAAVARQLGCSERTIRRRLGPDTDATGAAAV